MAQIIHSIFFQVCAEDNLPTAICQLCCDRLEEFHSYVLEVEEVQQNIHKMLSSQNYNAKKCVSHILTNRNFQSDDIGDLSKENDVNNSVNNLEVCQDAGPCVPDLRNDIELTSSSETRVMDSSRNQLPHLQDQCFVATDTESRNINETDVEYIKVEADPLEIENDDTGPAEDSVEVCPDSVKCESPTSKLLYRLLTSDKRCNFSTHIRTVSTACNTPSQTVQYRNNETAANKTILPIDNLRNKYNETSVSKEGESDVEEIQDSTAAQFQSRVTNTAASIEPGSQRYVFVVMWIKILCITFSSVLWFFEHLFVHVQHTKYIDIPVFQLHNHYSVKFYHFL